MPHIQGTQTNIGITLISLQFTKSLCATFPPLMLWVYRLISYRSIKKGCSGDPNNYRPISLTTNCCKVMERIIRPPGTAVPDGLMFYPWCIFFSFFLFSPRVLRAPSTDRPEILPHDRNLVVFYNPTPKIRGGGAPPKKFGGQKHAKFRSILDHFRLWSRIYPERLKISKIGRRYKLWQFLLHVTKKVRWTLVH